MQRVVVLFGNAGFGKDTVADHMVKLRPGMRKLGFADPIKEAAMKMLGIPREVAFGSTHIKDTTVVYGKTVRKWLRWVGEVGRKEVHPLVWVHRLCDEILRDHTDVVVYDARHWNELETPEKYLNADESLEKSMGFNFGGIDVRNILVYRPNHQVDLTHASETEVDDMRKVAMIEGKRLFHEIIINDGSIADLEKKVLQSPHLLK